MKLYKLLFFLFALVGLNSCVEYVDNGVKPEGGENPEQKKFTAEHSNPTEAKYVGDTFEFKAMMNSVDVTSSTKFKVNGSDIKGNTYIPHKIGDHSVIATMDDTYTANFKFKVLEKDEEPEEPTGNRIEYGGKSYPVSTTIWVLDGTVSQEGKIQASTVQINGTTYTTWIMMSSDNTDPKAVKNTHGMLVYVPINGQNIAFPYEAPSPIIVVDGEILVNGNPTFEIEDSTYTFAAGGNTAPDFKVNPPKGNSDYTNTSLGKGSGESAKLFWKGDYIFAVQKLAKAKGSFKSYTPSEINQVSLNKIKNIKLVK